MNLRLIREPTKNRATLGSLYVDGVWECWTLEDPIREVDGQSVETWKVKGDTAIPAGRYQVLLTRSPRFRKVLPLLMAVPGFTGIRIHTGNISRDTEGCILPGKTRHDAEVRMSRGAMGALQLQLSAATDDIWIEIENPNT